MNNKSFITKMSLLYYFTLALPLGFFVYVWLHFYDGSLQPLMPEVDITTNLLIIAIILLSAVGGIIYYKRSIQNAINAQNLRLKLTGFMTSNIVLFAAFEVASLAAVFGYFLSESGLFLAVYVGLLFYSTTKLRPDRQRVIKDLKLSEEEKEQLEI
ncbi:hypothetical protein OO013_13945 [Mangrovivirga sp. M17]|uniref:DUF4293 family protein n=1 Tax=Mangrovivirga halotolerans TaxID=2993936 RepID=A0ABT3RT78_9BACT|nr:hypothetical protein [Mangrovivirga halotolerans]MCX2744980.1 hypothetical protein [Mangrovivirga halotolerans]